MTDTLKNLRALHAAATPGPWKSHGIAVHPAMNDSAFDHPTFQHYADADLTAAMRNAIPALLAVAEAAEKCLPHVDPSALDYTRVHNQKVADCYLNTMLRKALAALSNHLPREEKQ